MLYNSHYSVKISKINRKTVQQERTVSHTESLEFAALQELSAEVPYFLVMQSQAATERYLPIVVYCCLF